MVIRAASALGTLMSAVALVVATPYSHSAFSDTGIAGVRDARNADNSGTSAGFADSVTVQDSARRLAAHRLIIPIAGVSRASLRDSFDERRGMGRHEAIDIAAPRGSPVLAVGDGRVVKLFYSSPGGRTVYQFDPDDTFAYYYGHLDAYAAGLSEGMTLKRGDVLGYVGTTGNAAPDAPHLHFAIFRLGPDKHWWQGTAVNPYPFLDDANR